MKWLLQGIILAIIALLLNISYEYYQDSKNTPKKEQQKEFEKLRQELGNNSKRFLATIDPRKRFETSYYEWGTQFKTLCEGASLLINKKLLQNFDPHRSLDHPSYLGCNHNHSKLNLELTEKGIKFKAFLSNTESITLFTPDANLPERPSSIPLAPLPIPDPFNICNELEILQDQAQFKFKDLRCKKTSNRYISPALKWRANFPLIESWKERTGNVNNSVQECFVYDWEPYGRDSNNYNGKLATFTCEIRTNTRAEALKIANQIKNNLNMTFIDYILRIK